MHAAHERDTEFTVFLNVVEEVSLFFFSVFSSISQVLVLIGGSYFTSTHYIDEDIWETIFEGLDEDIMRIYGKQFLKGWMRI